MDVTVVAPDSWIEANNVAPWSNYVSVQLEPNGAHRQASYDNVDFRLEKEFALGFGTVSIFADVFNLLGNKYVNVGLNPGGNWISAGPNSDLGTRTLSSVYNKIVSVTGLRSFKISARVSF